MPRTPKPTKQAGRSKRSGSAKESSEASSQGDSLKSRSKPKRASQPEAAGKPKRASRPDATLTLHALPMPSLSAMTPLLREQLGPLLEQALDDGPDGLALFTRFEVRQSGAHVYDLTLFAGEDGAVYRAGTDEPVASFSQGGATNSPDTALLAALDQAHQAWASAHETPLPAPASEAPRPAAAPSGIPRYWMLHAPDQYELGKNLNPRARQGLLRILKPPRPAELDALATYLALRGAGFVVEIGPAVPLSVLPHLAGVPFVVFAPARETWTGLEGLPASVRRLSIHKPRLLSLAALPQDNGILELELDTESVPADSIALQQLVRVAWTSAQDVSWIEKHPKLRELALRNTKITRLPASATLERLLLLKPSKLRSLRGIEDLPKLSYLRIKDPSGMERLGSLAACNALDTIYLSAAHRIGDLSDLVSAPVLRRLGVSQSLLDAAPFLGLKGKLVVGSFQLKSSRHSEELRAHLGIPFAKVSPLDNDFFDRP